MFAMSTYYALDIMIFLSLRYGKRNVTRKEITSFCKIPAATSKVLLDKLERIGLIHVFHEKESACYSLVKPPYDIRLSEIICQLEATLFTDYIGKDREKLPGDKAQLLYQKFRPLQYMMEKKLKRCRLSEWTVMHESNLHTV